MVEVNNSVGWGLQYEWEELRDSYKTYCSFSVKQEMKSSAWE